jgi:hypothetical protein
MGRTVNREAAAAGECNAAFLVTEVRGVDNYHTELVVLGALYCDKGADHEGEHRFSEFVKANA